MIDGMSGRAGPTRLLSPLRGFIGSSDVPQGLRLGLSSSAPAGLVRLPYPTPKAYALGYYLTPLSRAGAFALPDTQGLRLGLLSYAPFGAGAFALPDTQ